MTDNKNLVVRSEQHLMVQVEAANTRLAISSQLTQDIERRRFVEILKRIDKEDVVTFLSENTEINEELLEKYWSEWTRIPVSGDKLFLLSQELIERNNDKPKQFEYGLSSNEVLPWSLELIGRFRDKWNWDNLSFNEALPWSLELIKIFRDKWNWEYLSCNKALPYSLELIQKFEDNWNWKRLSGSDVLPWSLQLIECFEDKWDWARLSFNESLPWTLELLEQFNNRWDWWNLAWNESLPWSLELLERFNNKWGAWDLNTKAAVCLPKLTSQDIDEVMSYHFPLTQISKQSNDFDDDLPF